MNATRVASGLRFIASQCSEEAARPEFRGSATRSELLQSAVQLSTLARQIALGSEPREVDAWRQVATNKLVDAILSRTKFSDVPRA